MRVEIDSTLIDWVLDLAVALQQIPAPSLDESRRGAFVAERFRLEGLQHVSTDAVGNIYGCLIGAGQAPPLVVSAHLDTVFPLETDLNSRRQADRIFGPGIGDNSLGVAGLFGLLWALRQRHPDGADRNPTLPGDIWLVANVGEEGLGDLLGMRAVVDRFGDSVLAYLVLEGMALGQVYHRGLGVRRYRISTETEGGHSWVNFGRPSAIQELASLVVQLAALPLSERPRTTLNVGVISGGISVNTIAPAAHLELDLRSEEMGALDILARRVETLVQGANRPGVRTSCQVIGDRPAGDIPASHPLVALAARCVAEQGLQPRLNIGSTDANIPLSRGLPAICLGLTSGAGAHTPAEFIHTRPLGSGLASLVAVVETAFQELNVSSY